MNLAPDELIYALLFGAVLLVQYLMKRFGGRQQPADALQEPHLPEEQPPDREASVPSSWGRVPALTVDSLAAAQGTARRKAPATSAAIQRPRAVARSLLNGGPDLRRAIVGMTLLGPCRAQEPPENR